MFSGLEWDFPLAETTGYLAEHFELIMPLLLIIVGVLLALLVVDGITSSFLKVLKFVAGVRASGFEEARLGTQDDSKPD